MEKQIEILGYIHCPTCGTAEAMRISRDKNGHPFGWCERNCGQQLRVGPDPRRVRDFFKYYPQLTERKESISNPGTIEPIAETKKSAPIAAPKLKKRSAFEEGLSILGAI